MFDCAIENYENKTKRGRKQIAEKYYQEFFSDLFLFNLIILKYISLKISPSPCLCIFPNTILQY